MLVMPIWRKTMEDLWKAQQLLKGSRAGILGRRHYLQQLLPKPKSALSVNIYMQLLDVSILRRKLCNRRDFVSKNKLCFIYLNSEHMRLHVLPRLCVDYVPVNIIHCYTKIVKLHRRLQRDKLKKVDKPRHYIAIIHNLRRLHVQIQPCCWELFWLEYMTIRES